MRRKKKIKSSRKQILKETEMDKISGTDITEKLYQRHPDLEQLDTPSVTSSTGTR